MAQAAQQQPHPRANRQHPRRGIRINLTVDSRDGKEREVFAHAPIPPSAGKKYPSSLDSPDPSQQADQQPTDFDEPAPVPEEGATEEAAEKPSVKEKHHDAAQSQGQGETPEEESYRPFSKTGEEEEDDEFGQQGSEGDTEEDQREGGGSGEEQEKSQSNEQGKGHTAGDAQAQNSERAADQSADQQGADQGGGQQGRQSRQQKAAAAKAEAEKKAASVAAEALEKKLNPQFMATKEFILWCWRTVIISFGTTLIAITAYYLSIFCFHPPGFCEPGEEFDIPGDKTWRNTIFTVGVTFITIIAIVIAGTLLVLIIFLSMCANPAGFIANWGPCLEAFRTVK